MPTLIDQISAQVTASDQKPAARFEQQSITYTELGHKADIFASHLIDRTLPDNSLIAVYMDRSLEMLIALLGIMKAGHGYLPIDPAFPANRINYMLEHSEVKTIVCNQKDHASLHRDLPLPAEVEFEIIEEILAQPPTNLIEAANQSRETDLAYVIYTSGSTGVPKGVTISHKSVLNLLSSMAVRPGFNRDDTLAAVTTLSFDISVLELFLPLVTGGCVEIVSKEVAGDGEQLSRLVADRKITVMQATPSTWQMLQAAGWQGDRSLKVLIGGEDPPRPVVEKLLAGCGEVWNMYGPTETTVWSSCSKVENASQITLGDVVDNTRFYVLDDNLLPVSKGSEGLLYIGGDGLSRGYLRQDDMTRERFIQYPEEPSGKIYNTGDIVYLRADNDIEYRRRADNQVKFNGFRIETGEIESQLNEIDGILQSAVKVDNSRLESELVAYVTFDGSTRPTSAQLRDDLNNHLPAYMIPNLFLLLDKMPLTPNGKIDRSNLPETATPIDMQGEFQAPRDETESIIQAIWQEVLGLDKISVDASFYEMGGHSLLATRIWARLKRRFGVDLHLNQIFNAPTIQAQAIEVLGADIGSDEQTSIPVASRMKAPEMSLAQQRFWYIDQVAPHESLYNLCSAFNLKGSLSVSRLERCMNGIIERHEIMRTSVDWTSDTPKQIISRQIAYELPIEDLGSLPEESRRTVLMERLNEIVHDEIELDRAPLFKARVFRLDDDEHVFFFMPHHLIWDGWSFDIFLKEIRLFYEADCKDSVPELDDLPIQYADYSVWHNRQISDDRLKPHIDYWKETLPGELPVLNLSTDYPRPELFSYNGSTVDVAFDAVLVQKVYEYARVKNTTANVVLLAIYFALLYRYTAQEDIIVGTPIQGRLNTETENMLGLFVNSLPIRVRLEDSLSFDHLVQIVKHTSTEAYQHQELPFEKLVEEVGSVRDISRTPIFQALFTFQEVSWRENIIGDLERTQIHLHNGTCPTDISYWVHASPRAITGAVEYSSDLFSPRRIRRFIRDLMQLTSSALLNPDSSLKDLEILAPETKNHLINELNHTEQAFQSYDSVAQLVAEQAKQYPDSTAVIAGSEELSYRDLDALSNQIARALQGTGLEKGQTVAVCLGRDENLPAALLAIWKCGATYIPVDPMLPGERMEFIVAHSKASMILTHSELADRLPNSSGKVLFDELDYQGQPDAQPDVLLSSDLPAYVIYTSGSTGVPKGVTVQHSAVINLLQSMAETPGLCAQDRMLAITTLSFDIHVLEIWLPLSVGASVVIVDSDQVANGIQIAELLQSAQVNVMQATPSTWRLLQACEWDGKQDLKGLIGGEASSLDLINFLLPRLASLWNLYGPTETTVWSTCHKILEDDTRPLIGRPIANTQCLVLDENLNLVPEGIEGELYIGGAGLTLGYLYDREKTDDVFLDVELEENTPRRLYKTGDVVIMHESGDLEYVRRIDTQVKVRGYRIELDEIEAALRSLEQIADAIVIVREDVVGDKRIVAYFIPASGASLTITELRNLLRARLPAYMYPQYLIAMDSFPTTPNGKYDRKALPPPYDLHDAGQAESLPPQTETEKLIADSWIELIGAKQIGRHDNFFELGGHSLLSMNFINAIRKSSGATLTPRDIVLNDLSKLASIIEKQLPDLSATKADSAEAKSKSPLSRLIDRFG